MSEHTHETTPSTEEISSEPTPKTVETDEELSDSELESVSGGNQARLG